MRIQQVLSAFVTLKQLSNQTPSPSLSPSPNTGLSPLYAATENALTEPHDATLPPAYPQQPPHAGRHFLPSHRAFRPSRFQNPLKSNKAQKTVSRRFFEGWYYRITIPDSNNTSFAFIFSIEDPFPSSSSKLSCAAVQVMGPNDQYTVQADTDATKLWAFQGQQSLGCTFEWATSTTNNNNNNDSLNTRTALHPDHEWHSMVQSGFQMLPNRLQGKVRGHDGSLGGIYKGQGVPLDCDFDMSITPLSGWGSDQGEQRSTAGWLASYSVFDPHWQVTMADGRATGYATWNGTRYDFVHVPFYAEKNWGGSFPMKWYWVQCNSFDGSYSPENNVRLAITAGGGRRKLPWMGQTEDLGMVSVHHNGVFYEAVPWTSTMSWDVDPWGRWLLTGRNTEKNGTPHLCFEVQVEVTLDPDEKPGVLLRAPTEDSGLVYFCKDSFYGNMVLSLYELEWNGTEYVRKNVPPIIDRATSPRCAVEIGGGPWYTTWKGTSKMKQPMRSMVRFPYRFRK